MSLQYNNIYTILEHLSIIIKIYLIYLSNRYYLLYAEETNERLSLIMWPSIFYSRDWSKGHFRYYSLPSYGPRKK